MGIIRTAVAIAADNTFGPQFLNRFDLTLLFQHSILTILPSALLILACPAYIYHHARKAVVADAGALLWAKLAVAFFLVAIEVYSTVSWSQQQLYRSDAAVVAAAMLCISYASLGVLLFVEHRHSFRPSGLLAAYLILTTIFDGAKVRTHFTRTGLTTIGSLCIASIALKVVLVILGEISKRSLIRDKKTRENITPEAISGFCNRIFFVWLNRTLLTGFNTFLHIKDLPDLEPKFRADALLEYFGDKWAYVNHVDRNALCKLSFASFWPAHIAVIVPRLLFSAFNFSQPFIIEATVHNIGGENSGSSVKLWLVIATLASYLGRAVTKGLSDHFVNRCVIQLRGALNALLLQKSLNLTFKDAQETAAVSLMSSDVEGVLNGIRALHDTWSGLIDLGIGFYLIASMVKQSAFLAAVPSLLAFLITLRVSVKMVPARKIWSESLQTRIAGTTKYLSQLKAIKITGLSPMMLDYINGLRKFEVTQSVKMRRLAIIVHTITTLAEETIPTAVIAGGLFWTGFAGGFNAASVFSLLSVISIITEPLSEVPSIVPNFSGAIACTRRIQEFLLLKDRRDRRIIGNYLCPAGSCHDEQALGKRSSVPSHVGLSDTTFPRGCAVALRNVSLKYDGDRPPIVKDASLAISKGDFHIVSGPIGAGKTSLLHSIIGEMDPSIGTVYVHESNIAYCSQTPFIQNVSIRKNITGDREFDLPWYCKIIKSCELDEDLKRLEHGDQTLAGSGGARLSGGQKQRVAMAQALYSCATILVLDDPFSAVDFTTASKIFTNLFDEENGLVRQMKATVIMATQTVEFFAAGRQIHVLNGQGQLRTCNNISEVFELSATIPDMVLTQRSAADDKKHDSIDSLTSSFVSQGPDAGAGEPASFMGNDITDGNYHSRKSGDFQSYGLLLQVVPASAFVVYTILMLVTAVAERFLAIYVRIWVDSAPENSKYFIGLPLILTVFFIVHTAWYWQYHSTVVPAMAINMHDKLLRTIARADLTYISSKDTGAVLNRFSQDMTFVNLQLQIALLQVTFFTTAVLISLAVIASGASYTAIVIPFFFAVIYAIMFFYLRTSRQMRHLDLEGQTPLYTHFTETTTGLRHIRSLGRQSEFLRAGLAKLDNSQKPYYYMMTIQRWLGLVLDLVVLVIAVFLESLALYLRDGTSEGATGLALLNLITFARQLQKCVMAWTAIETSIGVVSRLKNLMEQTPLESDVPPPDSLPPNWPTNGEVQMKNVVISYSLPGKTSVPVLRGVSCSIFPGARVALEGRTGSGKSSFILSLLSLIDRSGDIQLDDIDPNTVPPDLLRSRITTISQDPVKLHGTVRNNLLPPGIAHLPRAAVLTDEDIIDILNELQIWQFIRVNGGLDAQYDELGFSHGQQQVVALAGAVIHNRVTNTKLVLMDEATSHLDYETDDIVQAYLMKVFRSSTVISVTHRRNGFPDPDYTLRFIGGELETVFGHSTHAIEVINEHDANRNQEKFEEMNGAYEDQGRVSVGENKSASELNCSDVSSDTSAEKNSGSGILVKRDSRRRRFAFKRKHKRYPSNPQHIQGATTVSSIPIGLSDYGVRWNDPPPRRSKNPEEMLLPIGISIHDLPAESRRIHSPNSWDVPDDLDPEIDDQPWQEQDSSGSAGFDKQPNSPPTTGSPVTERSSSSTSPISRALTNRPRREAIIPEPAKELFIAQLDRIGEEPEQLSRGIARHRQSEQVSNPLTSSTESSPRVVPNLLRDNKLTSSHCSGESSSGQPREDSRSMPARANQHIAALAMGPLPQIARVNPQTDKGKGKMREPVIFSAETLQQREEERLRVDDGLKEAERRVKWLDEGVENSQYALKEKLREKKKLEGEWNEMERQIARTKHAGKGVIQQLRKETKNTIAQEKKADKANQEYGDILNELSLLRNALKNHPQDSEVSLWQGRKQELLDRLPSIQENADKQNQIAREMKESEKATRYKYHNMQRHLNAMESTRETQREELDLCKVQEEILEDRLDEALHDREIWRERLQVWRGQHDEWDMKYNRPQEYANMQLERSHSKGKEKGKAIEQPQQVVESLRLSQMLKSRPLRQQLRLYSHAQTGFDPGVEEPTCNNTDRDSDGCTIFEE